MFPLLAALALAFASAADKAASPPTPSGGSLAGIVTSDDYPPQALDKNEQGSVGILVRVDSKGAVADCVVEKSSGSAALDAQTCRLVWLRAKFKPARDASGEPVEGSYQQTITWLIGEDWVPSEPWSETIVMRFTPDGRPLSCRMEGDGAQAPRPGEKPSTCPDDVFDSAPKLSDVPGAAKLTEAPGAIASIFLVQRFTPGPSPGPALAAGDTLISRLVVDLSIGADGKVTSCKISERKGLQLGGDPCVEMDAMTFEPRPGADGKSAPFKAQMAFTTYMRIEKLA